MKGYLLYLSLLFTIICLYLPQPNQAIPVFARKYGFHCTMCHSNFPRLNDYGQRYRDNGYRLPGRENNEQTVLEGHAPVAFRTSVGYTSDNFSNTPGAEDINQFQVNGLDILSGGLFSRNAGYIFVYPPQIEATRGVEGQTGTIELANAVFPQLSGNQWFNLRVGRMEGAYIPFSSLRRLTVSPYEIYTFPISGTEGFVFGETQTGLEATGYDRRGFKYAVGWVNGSTTNFSDDSPSDVYVRVSQVFGHGNGQTAGQRIGLIGYFGNARPGDGLPATDRESFNRFGVDASLNYRQLNLALCWMAAHDSGALWGVGDDVDYNGGFAELNFLPSTNFVGFARYDWVDTPDILGEDISRWTVGGRYYFADNLALHLEYSHRTQLLPGPNAEEDFATARLDFAF